MRKTTMASSSSETARTDAARRPRKPCAAANPLFPVLGAALVVGVLYWMEKTSGLIPGIVHVVIMMAGMITAGALAAFQRLLAGQQRAPLVSVSFNEVLVRASIPKALGPSPPVERVQKKEVPVWAVTLGQLVGTDNALALAKLRMDLQQEVRRLAYDEGIDVGDRPLGSILPLLGEMEAKEILVPGLSTALRAVLDVCNQAVHGGKVSNEVAASVVRVGGELLSQLRVQPHRAR
jgi:hypothetical protein